MLLLWFLILSIIGAINCDGYSENYILEISDGEIANARDTPFKVYWNVPTKQCRYQKNSIPFDDILRKYSISYNKDDKFEGETITIIYDGGFIPAILKRDSTKFSVRNGGLPQAGNLELHLTAFRETVIRLIPDPHFNGVGVIDMESWRPIFRQHWSNLASIIDLSLSIEKRQYWWWPSSWLKMEATKRFEDAARIFMERTLTTAKQMRPRAIWGYYGFPYCFNMGKDMNEHCSTTVKAENDRTYWLWAESTALYPSLYSSSQFSTSELEALVRGRLTEANRVKQAGTLVLPYFWIKYRDGDFIKEEDLIAVFEVLQKKNASGLVIWGASGDVNRIEKCKQLYKYVNSILGPIVKKYIQRVNKVYVNKIKENSKNEYVNGTFNNTININTATTQRTIWDTNKENKHNNNSLITTEKLKNTSFIYEQEQLHKYYYGTDENKTSISSPNESDIWDIISYEQNLEEENKLESITNTEAYLSSSTAKTISNENSSLNNDILKENLSVSSNRFNNTSNLTTFLIINNTESNIFNDLINNAGNLKNYMKTLVKINDTEINTETDPEIIHIIEEEQYYKETDSNKTDLKSFNESNIWNIVKYKENLAHENNTETVVKIKYTEPSYMNKTTFNENNIDPTVSIIKNAIQNISNDLAISLVNLTKTMNSSENKNNSELITDPVAMWLTYENHSKDVNISDAKRNLINGSFHNIDETIDEEENIFDDSVTSSVYLTSLIDTQVNNYKIGITENVIKSNNNYSIYSSQEDFNDSMNTSENFTNSVKTLVNINFTEINTETDPEIGHIIEEEQQLGKYYYETGSNKTYLKSFNESNIWNIVKYKENLAYENNTETVEKITYTEPSYMNKTTFNENNIDPAVSIIKNAIQNISNDLAISLVNLTKTMNSSENKNNSEITDPVAMWLTYENHSKDVNISDAKRNLINGSFHNIDETIDEEENIFDDSVTSSVNLTSLIDTQVNNYKIGITENVIKSNNNYSIYSSQEDFNDSMNTSENFTNSVKTLVNINFTEINTETDPEIGHIIEEEQQLGKYYYETGSNKTDLKSFNESNIWNIIKYKENLAHENNTEYVVKIKYTEPAYMNKTTFNENNIDPTVSIIKNAIQNISNDLAISLVNLTKTMNSSENKNNSEITDPVAMWLTYENHSKDVNISDAKRNLINGSFHNIDETIDEEENIFDDSVTSSVNLTSLIDTQLHSYKIGITENVITSNNNYSIYNSQEEKNFENNPYQIIEGPDIRENDISDDLITVEANFNSFMNKPMQIRNETIDNLISDNSLEFTLLNQNTNYSKSISQNFKQDEQLIENVNIQNIETPAIKENDISDNLITVAVNFTSPTNISVNSNDTRIVLKNLEPIKRIELLDLLPSNYFEINFQEISENVIQEELITQNTTYPNIEATISTENNISDDSLTSGGKISSNTPYVNSSDTGIKEKNKLENSLDFKLLSANNYSEAISQYIKLDEQTIKDSTDINIKAPFVSGNEMPDYLIILAEDTNQMNKTVNSDATDIIKNDSQYQQEDQLNKNFTKFPVKATASSENDISDYLIILTRNTSSPINTINTSVKVSNIDEEKEYKEVDENYSTSNENYIIL